MDEGWSMGTGKAVLGDGQERGHSGDRHRVPLAVGEEPDPASAAHGKGPQCRQVLPKTSPRMEVASRSWSNCCHEKYGVTYLLQSLIQC